MMVEFGGILFAKLKTATEFLSSLIVKSKINIINNVHIAYFDYLKAAQLLDVARSNLMSSQQQLALVQRQFELGSAKKLIC